MRKQNLCISLASLAVGAMAVPAMAVVGQSTILAIDHTQNGTFTPVAGGPTGANSASGTAVTPDLSVSHTGSAGDIARVYYVVPNSVDSSPALYKISWWESAGGNAFQPFEVQYNGVAGDSAGFDPNIPWHGQFGTNHQYMSNNQDVGLGAYNSTGAGPQSPGDASDGAGGADFTKPANPTYADGTSVWLKPGSEIFVKWDFGFYSNTENTVSDIRITEVPEPASLSLLGLGAAGLLARRRRASIAC